MSKQDKPVAVVAASVPLRPGATGYPAVIMAVREGRSKSALGDLFGLTNFGVNLTRLAPRSASSARHAHTRQDEFVYILQGHPTLCTDEGRTQLSPGMCAGFKAGSGNAHNLVNETDEEVIFLEVGDRLPGDESTYFDVDARAVMTPPGYRFTHKDGTPY